MEKEIQSTPIKHDETFPMPQIARGLMKVALEGIEIQLAHPDELDVTWVGQEEAMRQLAEKHRMS